MLLLMVCVMQLLVLQGAARLMAAGDYESALPVALEAVTIGEKLFKPQPALQLFPLYLLAAQVGSPGRLGSCHAVIANKQQQKQRTTSCQCLL